MFFLVKYSKSLEEGSFRNRSADFLWMLLFGAAILDVAGPWVNIQFLGSSLTFMMVRSWPQQADSWCDAACCRQPAAVRQCVSSLMRQTALAVPPAGLSGSQAVSPCRQGQGLSRHAHHAQVCALCTLQVYVWGRRHQYVNLSFLGIFTFTAPYLPWVLLAFSCECCGRFETLACCLLCALPLAPSWDWQPLPLLLLLLPGKANVQQAGLAGL
jgi:hypothetical protein